jgi:hypothetical protein
VKTNDNIVYNNDDKVKTNHNIVNNNHDKVKTNDNNSKLEVIKFDKFSNIDVLEDGVCGLKVCCIRVEYNGTSYILKEMRKSFNYGKDYAFIDELKDLFGVKPINMKRIKCDKYMTRIDTKKKTLVKNWKFIDGEAYYCMMNLFDNIGDIGKHKEFLEDQNVFINCLKIRLYDGLFCSSDNIQRNILVNSNKELLSIDEGDIYGKRKNIFNKNDWFTKAVNLEKTKIISNKIIEQWILESKIDIVKETLIKYGFSDKVDTMKERFLNYKNIIKNELNINSYVIVK